jgi:hypothetical protein
MTTPSLIGIAMIRSGDGCVASWAAAGANAKSAAISAALKTCLIISI